MSAGFGVENLPYGAARLPDGATACVTVLGDDVVDLASLARAGLLAVDGLEDGVLEERSLNRFLACGRPVWSGVRRAVAALAAGGDARFEAACVPLEAVELGLPVAPGDFVDFSASIHHAANAGRLLRPAGDPLPPQFRHQPVAYQGRAGSVVRSGTAVPRPRGQVRGDDGAPVLSPTAALDFEAEVGFVVGAGNGAGNPIAPAAFDEHVAGLVLVNDWSARDVQRLESRPLGPFNGKSFATSVSPWLVTLDALAPYRAAGPAQEPPPAPHLATGPAPAFDLSVEVTLQSEEMRALGQRPLTVTRASFVSLYWTLPQLLAHATVNGARTRPGDLFASGTVSGPDPASQACLLELTEDGTRPFVLPDGSTRTWLEDGDTVVVRAWAGGDGRPVVSLGEVAGTVVPAPAREE